MVVGLSGVRVFPEESQRRTDLFEFMASPVSSEKPKGATVREIAAAMRRTKESGEKILAVLGPAVVHTGGSEWVGRLIRHGYLNVLFAGNALATHDMEQAFFGTSLPERGESFEALLHYLFATAGRIARAQLEADSALPPWPAHRDGSRWVWWAEEAPAREVM